ncbi:MAG: aspartate aminotransferase family protein [Clostridia bacterium]|nr:MAG: aspartate aminotransferase family protein [Clostridia bacterium]
MFSVDEALRLTRQQVRENYQRHVNPGLAGMLGLLDFDKRFVRAEGAYVWDAEGKRYTDFLGGYGALNLGHNPPEIMAAIEKVRQAPNILQASLGAVASALAANLAEVTPGNLSRCFFGNSGTEAVEGALKLARMATGRSKIVYCHGSFHGKTLGSLSVTGREKYQKPFRPLVPDCQAIPYGDLDSLRVVLQTQDVAAFIVEPIQGEGGIIVPPDGYLAGARELCSRYGTLLVVDEVQTGLGRTGYLFAVQHEDVVPDVLCLAKSLGGGIMPIGVFVTTPAIWDKAYGAMDKCLLHTSTFGGNTWAAAAGIAALEVIISQDLPGQAREKGEYLLARLNSMSEKYPLIKEVRGRGLMIGMEFSQPTKGLWEKVTGQVVNKFSEEYLASLIAGKLINTHQIITAYTLNNPNVIRLEPPLIVDYADLDRLVESLESIFQSYGGFGSLAMASARTMLTSLVHRH